VLVNKLSRIFIMHLFFHTSIQPLQAVEQH
jgi:hypothetical protein